MTPSIGRIVVYNCNEQDIKKQEALNLLGKGCNVQKQLPAVIVAVWSESCVNLKVLCDGNTCLWITSAQQGTNGGQWSEPERV